MEHSINKTKLSTSSTEPTVDTMPQDAETMKLDTQETLMNHQILTVILPKADIKRVNAAVFVSRLWFFCSAPERWPAGKLERLESSEDPKNCIVLPIRIKDLSFLYSRPPWDLKLTKNLEFPNLKTLSIEFDEKDEEMIEVDEEDDEKMGGFDETLILNYFRLTVETLEVSDVDWSDKELFALAELVGSLKSIYFLDVTKNASIGALKHFINSCVSAKELTLKCKGDRLKLDTGVNDCHVRLVSLPCLRDFTYHVPLTAETLACISETVPKPFASVTALDIIATPAAVPMLALLLSAGNLRNLELCVPGTDQPVDTKALSQLTSLLSLTLKGRFELEQLGDISCLHRLQRLELKRYKPPQEQLDDETVCDGYFLNLVSRLPHLHVLVIKNGHRLSVGFLCELNRYCPQLTECWINSLVIELESLHASSPFISSSSAWKTLVLLGFSEGTASDALDAAAADSEARRASYITTFRQKFPTVKNVSAKAGGVFSQEIANGISEAATVDKPSI